MTRAAARCKVFISLAASIVAVAACTTRSPESSRGPTAAVAAEPRELAMTAAEIQHGGIRWEQVDAATMTATVEIPGQLVPNEDRTARLGAPARARVVTVHVRIGDQVAGGQTLVTLQSEQAASAGADYAKAVADMTAHEASARYARSAFERAQRLLDLKAVSRQDVERARAESEDADSMRVQAQIEVDRARTALTQLGVSNQTGEMLVRAPLGGIVLSREAAPGSVVEAGAALVTVSDPATLWLEIGATERVAPSLRRGNRLTFTVPELEGETFLARIEDVGAALDPATRTLPVHSLVQNTTGVLRPAMFATVMLPVGPARQGLAVAESAMQLLDERPVVFVARPEAHGGARFERRNVEVGARSGNRIQILKGLSAGDAVVTSGAFIVKSQFARSTIVAD